LIHSGCPRDRSLGATAAAAAAAPVADPTMRQRPLCRHNFCDTTADFGSLLLISSQRRAEQMTGAARIDAAKLYRFEKPCQILMSAEDCGRRNTLNKQPLGDCSCTPPTFAFKRYQGAPTKAMEILRGFYGGGGWVVLSLHIRHHEDGGGTAHSRSQCLSERHPACNRALLP
jgi:hypothetical protein